MNIKIAYIGGGSNGWARILMGDLAKENSFTAEVNLYDINFAAAKDNEQLGNELSERDDIIGKHHYTAVKTLKEALTGADFVFISILPATFDEMESDVHTPEKYGIYQSVGDTSGPGGIVRAMRTIPMFKEIAENIKMYSPNAWVVNYTNPMTLCVRTLYEVFPEIKAFGCCHEVFSTQKLLCAALKEKYGIDAKRTEIKVSVSGVNHFTWLTEAKYGNIDLFEAYRELGEKYSKEGFGDVKENWANGGFLCAQRVKFDLFKRYGVIAAAGDRHLAEFCPGKWYLESPEKVAEWKFGLTPVSWRKEEQKRREDATRAFINHEKPFEVLLESGEEAVEQIKAILGLGDFVTNCNMPNVGQVKGLPMGAVVETNASFTSDSVTPVMAKDLPYSVLALVQRISLAQEVLVKAILAQDYDAVFNCFANDPLVTISLDDAKKLFLEMVANTKEWIPGADEYLKKNGVN